MYFVVAAFEDADEEKLLKYIDATEAFTAGAVGYCVGPTQQVATFVTTFEEVNHD